MTLWHTQTVEAVLRELNVDTSLGLSDDEVARRREQYGSNELIERGGKQAGGVQVKAADLLGITFRQFRYLAKKYQIR